MDQTEKLRSSLLLAYGIIREQEDTIYTLTALVTPLVKCLAQYDHHLADLYSRTAKTTERRVFQKRDDALAVIDEAVRRLKENVN
ncbi:MAG: hypothetical protein ABSE82_11250 [Nitrososphaerales archaeon]|jgi:uncharacterized coiled-coil protein SlyX